MHLRLTFLQPQRVNEPSFTFNDALILFWHTVRDFLKGMVERLPCIIVGAFVFLLFWLLGKGVKKVINKVAVQSHSIDDTLANLVSRIISTIITIIGFLATSVVIFPPLNPATLWQGWALRRSPSGLPLKTFSRISLPEY